MRSDVVTGYGADEPSDEDLAHIEATLSLDDQRRVRRHINALVWEALRETADERQAAMERRDAELFGSRPVRRSVRQRSRSVVLRVLPGGLSDEPVRGDVFGEEVA